MIQYASYPSPFGLIEIGCRNQRILSIRCTRSPAPQEPSEITRSANLQLQEYFEGRRKSFDLPVEMNGTPFQLAVWQQLQKIPYGTTCTYAQIAAAIGNPKASRAVGQAIHRNPLWIVVPCHRVIGSDGKMSGYAGGPEMKRALLKLESMK